MHARHPSPFSRLPQRFGGALAILLLTGKAAAEILVQYDPAGLVDSGDPLANTLTASHLSAGDLTKNGALDGLVSLDAYKTSSWGASLDTSKYLSFTVTPDVNYSMQFSSLEITTLWVDVASAANIVVRSSADGFTGNVGGITSIPIGASTRTISLASISEQFGATTFHVHFYGGDDPQLAIILGSANLGALGIALNGVMIPEAGGFATALGLGAAGCVMLWRRRRKAVPVSRAETSATHLRA